jgi:hypothetical protein
MSNVQSAVSSGTVSSGTPGVSLPSVVANHGLVAWLFFDNAITGITSVLDSSGTTWTAGPVIQLTTNAEAGAYAFPNSSVGAGTHTLTVNFTGGGSCRSFMIEDTNSTLSAFVQRRQNSPGAGLTINPGGTVGASGSTVYLFAADATLGAVTNEPVVSTGGFTALQQSFDVVIGSWLLGVSSTAGGTTPAFAPGSLGSTDEYYVCGVAVSSSSGTSVNLTAQTATFTEGTLSDALSYALTGQTVTASEGTPSRGVSYGLTGQSITSSVGTLTPQISTAVTGQSITSTEGSAVPGVSYGLTQETATFTQGTITASTGGNVTLSLTGQTATFTEGALTPGMGEALTGQSITSSEGTIASEVDLVLGAQSITSTEGTITPQVTGNVTVQLTALQSVFSLGTISVTGASSGIDTHDGWPVRTNFQVYSCEDLKKLKRIARKLKKLRGELRREGRTIPEVQASPKTERLRADITELTRALAQIRRPIEDENDDEEAIALCEQAEREEIAQLLAIWDDLH